MLTFSMDRMNMMQKQRWMCYLEIQTFQVVRCVLSTQTARRIINALLALVDPTKRICIITPCVTTMLKHFTHE